MIEETGDIGDQHRGIRYLTGANPKGAQNNHSLQHRSLKSEVKAVIPKRLIAARELNGYQQTEAANLLGYKTSSQLSQWEQGRRMPPLERLLRASQVYRVSLDYLFGVSDDPDRDPVSTERRILLNSAEGMLNAMAHKLADAVIYQTNLGGPTVQSAQAFVGSGERFMESFNKFISLNRAEFEEMRGGASLQTASADMGQAVAAAREILERHRRINQAAMAGVVRQVRPHDSHSLFETVANDNN